MSQTPAEKFGDDGQDDSDPRRSTVSVVWASLRGLFTGHPDRVPPADQNDSDEGYPETTLGTLGGESSGEP